MSLKIVCISDTHGKWSKLELPECDILISAGDYSFRGERHMIEDFHKWLNKQKARHIISLQGNHELIVEQNFNECKEIAEKECPRVIFTSEDYFEIEGVKFFVSATTPFFMNWAWNKYPAELVTYWDRIPDDIQVLVTHGPPFGIMDLAPDGNLCGCPSLLRRIRDLKELKMHCFGHIHGQNGIVVRDGVTFINASICNESYRPTQPYHIFDLT